MRDARARGPRSSTSVRKPSLVGARVARLVDARVDAAAHVLDEGAEEARVHGTHAEGGIDRHAVAPGHTFMFYNVVCIVVNRLVPPCPVRTACPRGPLGRSRWCERECGCRTSPNRAGVSVKTGQQRGQRLRRTSRPETRASVRGGARRDRTTGPTCRRASCDGAHRRDRAGRCRSWTYPYFAELPRFVVQPPPRTGLDRAGRPDRRAAQPGAGGQRRHSGDHLIDGLILSPVALDARRISPGGRRRHSAGAARREAVCTDRPTTSRSTTWRPPRTATAHLASQGRRRVAAIGDQPNSSQESGVAHLRRRGWEEALEAAGLPVIPDAGHAGALLPAQRRIGGHGDAPRTGPTAGRRVLLQRHAGAGRAAGAGRPRATCSRGRRRDRSRRRG